MIEANIDKDKEGHKSLGVKVSLNAYLEMHLRNKLRLNLKIRLPPIKVLQLFLVPLHGMFVKDNI